MNMPKLRRVKGHLSVNALYTCAACGKKEPGTTRRVSVDGDVLEVEAFLRKLTWTATFMPVGWSFNGEYNCGCKR